jgi:hypothetical protein
VPAVRDFSICLVASADDARDAAIAHLYGIPAGKFLSRINARRRAFSDRFSV